MRIGKDLAAWLGDEDAQARSIIAQRQFADGWAARMAPVVGALADEAGAATLLAHCEWVEDAIGWAAAQLAADPFLDPPLRMIGAARQRGLLLCDGPAATLSAVVMFNEEYEVRGAGTVVTTGARSIIRFVRGGGAILRRWRIDGDRCVSTGLQSIDDGDCLTVDGAREAVTIESPGRAIVSLRATMKSGRDPLVREYDRRTGMLIRRSAADPDVSRTQMMLALLRLMERRDAAPLFAQFVASDDAHLRWQAMREWLALDPQAALPHLRRMAASDRGGPAPRTLAMVEARIGKAA